MQKLHMQQALLHSEAQRAQMRAIGTAQVSYLNQLEATQRSLQEYYEGLILKQFFFMTN